MPDIAGPREDLRLILARAVDLDGDDLDVLLDSLTELVDARIAWDRDQPRFERGPASTRPPPLRDPHTPGSMRWLAARMVATANTAEDIEQARQRLMEQSKRQLIDLIQQLATEAAAL